MRAWIATALGLAAGIITFTAVAGLTGWRMPAAAVATLAALLGAWLTWRRPPVALLPSACSRGLLVIAAVASLAAVVQIARAAVYAVDSTQVGWSVVPGSNWEVRHSCLTSYYVAAEAAGHTGNVYDDALYSAPDDRPGGLRKPLRLGPFNIDVYEYPPPFLLLPRALLLVVHDFVSLRMLWFALDCAGMLAVMIAVARRMGPAAGTRALLLMPLVWAAVPTISFVQKGNVQGLIVAASIAAMLLFEKKRDAAGGALLAFATASKLYPGLLVVYLIARREWRAVLWTAAFGVGFLLLSLADTGLAPYRAFLVHLPGLLGGEAFPAFRNPSALAINLSVPGLVFKLKLFGVPGMGFPAAKVVGWIYTVVALAAVVALSRRPLPDAQQPAAWLAVLILATLRSPFLPQAYAAFPPLWLLSLLAALALPTARTLALTALGWVALNLFWPLDWGLDPRVLAVMTLAPQAVMIALAASLLWRGREARVVDEPGLASVPA